MSDFRRYQDSESSHTSLLHFPGSETLPVCQKSQKTNAQIPSLDGSGLTTGTSTSPFKDKESVFRTSVD